jgi:predicted nuclease of predicted toxin-antitoxin system
MIWLDAHLSPRVARWIEETLGQQAEALRDKGLRDAEDETIFEKAKSEQAIILTKDKDFADLVKRLGAPPAVIWLRCGNTSEENLKHLLENHLQEALDYIHGGEPLVEIR